MRRILWRSWSAAEAEYELAKMTGQLDWLNGHKVDPTDDDIWFTTNGYDYRPGKYKKMTWYAESPNYLKGEYDLFCIDTRWDHRFHFNPNYGARYPKSSIHALGCWWAHEISDYNKIKQAKKIESMFGMIHGHKQATANAFDFGYMRSRIVDACRQQSFRYYGSGWDQNDPNYRGEIFNSGRTTPDKFTEARHLMAPAKFVWCVENAYDSHYSICYLTEKLFHGFLSHSVPIYAGCYNIQDVISTNLFIDMRTFNFDLPAIIDHCNNMPDSEYNGYLDRIEEFLNTSGKRFTFNERLKSIDKSIHAFADHQ